MLLPNHFSFKWQRYEGSCSTVRLAKGFRLSGISHPCSAREGCWMPASLESNFGLPNSVAKAHGLKAQGQVCSHCTRTRSQEVSILTSFTRFCWTFQSQNSQAAALEYIARASFCTNLTNHRQDMSRDWKLRFESCPPRKAGRAGQT